MKPSLLSHQPFFFLTWIRSYSARDLLKDLVAGVTIGVVIVPQSMAYAVLAGLPPVYGLYASVVPLIVYPLFGTSRHVALGIVAIDMLLVAAAVEQFPIERRVELAITLALMVGAIQVVMGVARLGFIVNLLSRPVISGFTTAAALIIGLSQVGNLVGVKTSGANGIVQLVIDTAGQIGSAHLAAAGIGLSALVILLLIKRFVPIAPGPLIAVIAGTVLVAVLRLDATGVAVVGDVPAGMPAWDMPNPSLSDARMLFPTAFSLALIQFMSVISLGKVFGARFRYTVKPNRELLAIGTANFSGSFFQSLPVSGSFSRSAINAEAGARSSLSNAFASIIVILTLLFFTRFFFYLPMSVLAAIIMVAAFGLVDVAEMRFLVRTKLADGLIAIATFLATLFVGIQEGIIFGISLSVVAIMFRISRPHTAMLGHLPGTRSFRDLDRYPEALRIPGIMMLRVDASYSFANAEYLRDLLLEWSEEEPDDTRAVIIDASSINDLDTTAATVLQAVAVALRERSIDLYFAGAKGPFIDVMRATGLEATLGMDHFFLSPHRAVKHILGEWDRLDEYMVTVPEKSDENE